MNEFMVAAMPSTTPLPFAVDSGIPCTQETPSLFDPVEGTLTDTDRKILGRAEQVCLGCPVRAQCLDYATKTGQYGVWGGKYVIAGKVQRIGALARRGPSRPQAPAATGRPAREKQDKVTAAWQTSSIEEVQALLDAAVGLPRPRTAGDDLPADTRIG